MAQSPVVLAAYTALKSAISTHSSFDETTQQGDRAGRGRRRRVRLLPGRAAARGESVLSPAVAAKVLGRLCGSDREGLSSREIEVLTAVARGQGNRQVARALHISEATVKTHLLHPPAAHLRQARRG